MSDIVVSVCVFLWVEKVWQTQKVEIYMFC